MMFTCHERNSYFRLHAISNFRGSNNFLMPLFTYIIAQHKWWAKKEQVCLLATVIIYLRLMHNDFVWLYCTLFRRHRNVMEFVCLYAAISFSPFLDEGKEQRLVAASCVFPRNVMLSSLSLPPSFLICVLLQVRVLSFMYITGAWRTLVRAAILQLMFLHACIFRLKSAMLIRLCMLRLWLFKSKYCFYMR